MVKKMNADSKVFGFLMGPHGVYSNNYMEICSDYMNLYRNMGGFDMICKFIISNFENINKSSFLLFQYFIEKLILLI
jgi:pyrophosphate--fructose-6-phosphate 1-phosphotransferase